MQIEILEASSDTDINAAFAALHGLHGEALLVSPDPLFFLNQDRLVALAAQYAVPGIATITSTLQVTSSEAKAGSGSKCPSAHRYSINTF